jgi:hypothetical protein
MHEVKVTIRKPHEGQRFILDNKKRFNVVACGRRFGKTELAKRLLLKEDGGGNGALYGYPVAYFTPTYKMLSEVFRELADVCYGAIIRKDTSENRLEFYGGGWIDMWSMENFDSVRGRAYKRAVIDEAAINKSDKLKNAWEEAIRATLTDYKGDAFFLSTPKGKKHYFHSLFQKADTDSKWSSFKMPTLANPEIDPEEVQDAKELLPPIVFAQEYEAEFTDRVSDNLYIFSFNKHKHVPHEPDVYNSAHPLVVSIDFNVNPMCAILCQHDIHFRWVKIIGEYRLSNSDIYDLCARLRSQYDTRKLIITGDSSGWNRSASARGHKSSFEIIRQELNLSMSQVKVPAGKPANFVQEKRAVANALFSRHPDFQLSNCPFLIEDIENVEADEAGKMDKESAGERSHLLDCLCDYLYYMVRPALKLPIMAYRGQKPDLRGSVILSP